MCAEALKVSVFLSLQILQVNLVMSILLYVMVLVYLYGIQATNMDSSRQEQQQANPDPVNSLITQLLQADLTRGKTRVNQSQQDKSRDLRDTLPHLQDDNFPSEEHLDVETLENDDQLVMLLNSELLRKHRRYSSSRVLLSEHPPLHPPPLYPSDDFVSGVMDRSPASNKTRKKRQAHKSYSAEFSVCDSKSEWVWNKTKAVNMRGEPVTVLRTFTGTKGQVFSQYFYETYCNPSRHRGCRGIDYKNWNSQCKTTQTFVRAFTQTDNKPSWTWIRINTSCVCALSKKRRRT